MWISADTRLVRGGPSGVPCSLCRQEDIFVTFVPADLRDHQNIPLRRAIGLCVTCIGQLYQKTTEQGLPIITRDTPRPLELEPFSVIRGRDPGA